MVAALREVAATAYLTPLREGGSLPGLVEADDLGTYVVKFTGAGQGPKALVAEIIVGELARSLGIRTPELALIRVDAELGLRDPDEEVQELVASSAGTNLAVDFLPGSVGYEPTIAVPPEDAAAVVWLDAFVANVDRSVRNPNLLIWHRNLWAIDHGACLRFHHSWGSPDAFARSTYRYSDHVLARPAGLSRSGRQVRDAAERLAPQVTPELLDAVTGLVPDPWLAPDPRRPDPQAPADPDTARTAYRTYLLARLDATQDWLP